MAFNIVAGVNNAAYGSVTGSGSYEENDQVTLEVTANSGYRFVSWDDSNTDNPRVFSATEDVTLVATLEAIPEYTVTVNINNDNLGSVTGAGTYQENASVTVTATPVTHCAFSKFVIDNTDITTNPYTFTVTDNVLISTEFVTLNWYTITVTSDDANLGSVSGSGDYDEGDTVTLTATPETDCRFTGWSDGNIENPRTFQASASLNLTAYFEAIDYKTFSLTINDNTKGSVTGGSANRYEAGTQIELTAVPESGCKFVCWEINGEDIEYDNPLLFDVDDDTTIEAQFADIEYYTVNIFSTDADYGSVTIVSDIPPVNGKYQEGSELIVTAVPSLTGKFLSWGDDFSKVPERTIYVDGNIFLRANFCSAEGPLLVSTNTFKKVWTSIKNFFSASTGASKIGAPANNALNATTLADVVNSVGQPDGIALLNASGKVAAADIDGILANDTTGNAATATVAEKLGTATVGASDIPIYLNAGTATACGGSLDVDITGNAATATSATKATQDGSGNTITSTYATIAKTYDDTTNTSYRGMRGLDGSTSGWVRTTSSGIIPSQSGAAGSGHCGLGTSSWYFATAYVDNIYGKLNGNCTGSSGSCTGNAATATTASACSGNSATATTAAACTGNSATATTATNSNNSKLTHTVGNTEYPLVFGSSFVITDAQQALRIGTPSATANQCPLRVKAYCAAANTQGEAYLVLGNALATATANNSRGGLVMYGTGTAYNFIKMNTVSTNGKTIFLNTANTADITLTLPSTTGTIALTSSNITGSSASCTGNAATATSATTATNANNAKLTPTVGNTWYPVVFGSSHVTSASNQALRIASGSTTAAQTMFNFDPSANPTAVPSAATKCYLQLGNGIAYNNSTSYAIARQGVIRLYGNNTSYTDIVTAATTTARTLTLPNATGTVALTSSNITGSASKWGGYALSVVTALPSSPDANTIYLVK